MSAPSFTCVLGGRFHRSPALFPVFHPVQNHYWVCFHSCHEYVQFFLYSVFLAAVFPSNFIGLSFTFLYFVSKGGNVVILLNCDFGIGVTGEPLSIMKLICLLLTNAVIAKKSGPLLFIDRVECKFFFTEWIVFSVQSSSPALFVSASITWFTFLFARQHFAKWPIFSLFCTLLSSGGSFVLF